MPSGSTQPVHLGYTWYPGAAREGATGAPMSVSLSCAAFFVGAAVSLATSWVLVSRLERVGERFGLTEALLGMVAALAADAPEITASITALLHHQVTVGAGVILGSNVFNLAALLGLGAVVAGCIRLHRKVVVFSGTVSMVIGVGCFLTVGGQLSADVGTGRRPCRVGSVYRAVRCAPKDPRAAWSAGEVGGVARGSHRRGGE